MIRHFQLDIPRLKDVIASEYACGNVDDKESDLIRHPFWVVELSLLVALFPFGFVCALQSSLDSMLARVHKTCSQIDGVVPSSFSKILVSKCLLYFFALFSATFAETPLVSVI